MKKLFLLMGTVLVMQLCQGQTNIGISPPVFNAPTIVNYQDTAVISFAVKNYGPNVFNGSIFINVGIWDTSMTYVGVIHVDSTSLSNLTNFQPNDSIWVSFTEHYIPQNFRIGTSVVVIWPSALNATTIDTVSYTVEVQSAANIHEVGKQKPSMYPNPSSGKITIHPEGSAAVEQVRIVSLTGQVLLADGQTATIDISSLSPGIYFAEVTFSDGKQKVYRIIRKPE